MLLLTKVPGRAMSVHEGALTDEWMNGFGPGGVELKIGGRMPGTFVAAGPVGSAPERVLKVDFGPEVFDHDFWWRGLQYMNSAGSGFRRYSKTVGNKTMLIMQKKGIRQKNLH